MYPYLEYSWRDSARDGSAGDGVRLRRDGFLRRQLKRSSVIGAGNIKAGHGAPRGGKPLRSCEWLPRELSGGRQRTSGNFKGARLMMRISRIATPGGRRVAIQSSLASSCCPWRSSRGPYVVSLPKSPNRSFMTGPNAQDPPGDASLIQPRLTFAIGSLPIRWDRRDGKD